MLEATHRPATEADLPQLVAIYNAIIAEGGFSADLDPYTLEQRRSWFDAHQQSPFLIHVLEIDQQVLGYFYFSPWRSGRAAMRKVAEVSYYLAREARGKGLGRFMLEQAQQVAIAANLKYLLAILLATNIGSRTLLEKGGFTLAGELPEIADLGERRCGQLIMYKKLTEN
jgi:phosphinothricin acetyltransferase